MIIILIHYYKNRDGNLGEISERDMLLILLGLVKRCKYVK
jgi:hypothetical protein